MPNINRLDEVPRKDLHVIYVLDTSGSMSDEPIAMLNRAVTETVEALKELAKKNADAKLKIGVLQFNSSAKWVTSHGPEEVEDFVLEELKSGGLTDVGAALKELNDKLSRKKFLASMAGAYMPVIIFMSDGYPTDDYDSALTEIRKNNWFSKGIKIGIALGDKPDYKMIASVVGNSEAVIKATDLEFFKRIIKFVSVTSSVLASQSATTRTRNSGSDVTQIGKDMGILTDDDIVHLSEDEYDKESDSDFDEDFDEDDVW